MQLFDLKLGIVDNNSSDNSVEEISLKFPEADILVNSENLGYSEGLELQRCIDFSFSNGAENVF